MYLTGKDALRGVAEYDSVLNTHMILSNISTRSDTVYCSILETNDSDGNSLTRSRQLRMHLEETRRRSMEVRGRDL